MAESQTVIRIESELWRHFKGLCLLHNTTPTATIAALVARQVDAWTRMEMILPNKNDYAPRHRDDCPCRVAPEIE